MHRNDPAAALLGGAVAQLDDAADPPGRIEHHVPGQVGDLARPQAGLGRQQHDHAIAQRIAGAAGKDQQIVEIGCGQKFCLFAWHYDSNVYDNLRLSHTVVFVNNNCNLLVAGITDKETAIFLSVIQLHGEKSGMWSIAHARRKRWHWNLKTQARFQNG